MSRIVFLFLTALMLLHVPGSVRAQRTDSVTALRTNAMMAQPADSMTALTIGCPRPGQRCAMTLSRTDAIQSASIKLLIKGATTKSPILVTFKTSSGTVYPDTTTADSSGVVRTNWFRMRSADTAAVAVSAVAAKGTAVTMLLLEPEAVTPVKIVLEPRTGMNQSWFAGSLLRKTVGLELLKGDSIKPDSTPCRAQRVVFVANQIAGSVSPDTATADWVDNESSKGCFVRTFWTLGATPGPRRIRANVLPGPGYTAGKPIDIDATVRTLPKFVSGLAVVQRKNYAALKAGKDTVIRVERLLPGGEKLTYDSIKAANPSVEEFTDDVMGAIFAGISGPIVPGWHRISFTAGVDLAAPRDRWFAGLSLLRLFSPNTESFNVDVHVVAHWARESRLEDKDSCRASGACKTIKDIDFQKFGFVATLDAGSLLAELVKKLAP